MRKYLIHDVLSKRVQFSTGLNNKDFREIFHGMFRPQLLRIASSDDPQVYCLHNIQRYLTNSSFPWLQAVGDYLESTPSDSFENPNYFLDDLRYPLTQFSQEAIWMESNIPINYGDGAKVLSRGWMIYRDIIPNPCLTFVEFNRFSNGRIELSSVTNILLNDVDHIDTDTVVQIWNSQNDTLLTRQQIIPTLLLHLPLFALNILRTRNGFSMPIEDQGRRQLARRIGVRNTSGNYFFDVGPKMKHFVRGHIRVYTARQQTPLTVWVHPHTRGNRRPMQPGQHRRGSLHPAVGGNVNALQCTEDR